MIQSLSLSPASQTRPGKQKAATPLVCLTGDTGLGDKPRSTASRRTEKSVHLEDGLFILSTGGDLDLLLQLDDRLKNRSRLLLQHRFLCGRSSRGRSGLRLRHQDDKKGITTGWRMGEKSRDTGINEKPNGVVQTSRTKTRKDYSHFLDCASRDEQAVSTAHRPAHAERPPLGEPVLHWRNVTRA